MAMGKFPEAIYDFTWAIKNVTPVKEESQKNKSNLIETVKEDKEIPQKQAKYNRFAGNCYFEMSQYQEALVHYNEANKKEPDSA